MGPGSSALHPSGHTLAGNQPFPLETDFRGGSRYGGSGAWVTAGTLARLHFIPKVRNWLE